jgi:hypothetical protein
MVMTSALGRGSLGARARRLSDCHQQRQPSYGKGAATMAHRRLALAAVVQGPRCNFYYVWGSVYFL